MSLLPEMFSTWLATEGVADEQIRDLALESVSVVPTDLQPSQHVAAQVRRILRGEGDASVWARLNEALAEGGGGPSSLLPTSAAPGSGAPAAPGDWLAFAGRWTDAFFDSALAPYALAVAAACILLLILSSTARLRRSRRSSPEAVPSGDVDRRGQVRALVATGVPVADIARRMGLSRDAVVVLTRVRTS
jgi:hypothetical protein